MVVVVGKTPKALASAAASAVRVFASTGLSDPDDTAEVIVASILPTAELAAAMFPLSAAARAWSTWFKSALPTLWLIEPLAIPV